MNLDDKFMSCLVCGSHVETDGGTLRQNVNWHKGAEFRSHGNFGSQVHDMDGVLIAVVCDGCIIRRRDRMVHVARPASRAPEFPDHTSKQRPRGLHRGVTTAREHYDSWIAGFSGEDDSSDEYLRTVRDYFFPPRACAACGAVVRDPKMPDHPSDPTKTLCQVCVTKACEKKEGTP